MRNRLRAVVVFEQHGAREGAESVDQGRGGKRSGKMRDDSDEMRLADGGDFYQLGDAADVGKGDPHVVEIVILDKFVEIPALAPFLAGRERNGGHFSQLGDIFEKGFGPDGILDQVGFQVFKELASADGVGEVEALMEVDGEVAVLSDSFAGLGAVLMDLMNPFTAVVC